MADFKTRFREEQKRVRLELRRQMFGYIAAAFSLVAGLAWNDAVKGLIQYIFPVSHQGVLAEFIYAAAITFFVIIVISYMGRFINPPEDTPKAS